MSKQVVVDFPCFMLKQCGAEQRKCVLFLNAINQLTHLDIFKQFSLIHHPLASFQVWSGIFSVKVFRSTGKFGTRYYSFPFRARRFRYIFSLYGPFNTSTNFIRISKTMPTMEKPTHRKLHVRTGKNQAYLFWTAQTRCAGTLVPFIGFSSQRQAFVLIILTNAYRICPKNQSR